MSLIECQECSAKPSAKPILEANANQPQVRPFFRFLLSIIFVLVFGAVIYNCSTPNPSGEARAPKVGSTYKTKGVWPSASTPEDLDHALTIFKDREAFMKLCVQGRAAILKPGLMVFCDEFRPPGLVKIRFQGEPYGAWTVVEALEIP